MNRRLAALLLALAMLLGLLSGCAEAPAAQDSEQNGDSASEGTDAAEETQGMTELPEGAAEDVVAYLTDGAIGAADTALTANGVEISAAEYFYRLAMQYNYIAYYYASSGMWLDPSQVVDEETGETIGDSLREQVVSMCEMYAILGARAEEEGLSLSEDQQSELDSLDGMMEENLLLFYATSRDGLREGYERNFMATNLQDHLLGDGGALAATEETLASYANENGIYTCRYILLYTADLEEDDTEGREAQRQKAQELYDQLAATEAGELESTFASLQAEHNYDGNTDEYTFTNDDSLVSGFREVVAELAPGELGMSEETDYGYFVLLRLDANEETVREYYNSDVFNAQIDEWIAQADCQVSEALESVDMTAFFTRLDELQAYLNEVMTAESESETEAESETETEESADAGTAEETEDGAE